MKILFTFLYVCAFTLVHAQKRPNIVLILSDDHAYQSIGAYGSTLMETPHIDRIAKEGMLFKKAAVNNSICGPSRAAILTGRYSHKNGFKDNLNPNFDGSQDSFIKQLQNNGYLTAWIGKWHLGSQPQGFDFWKILKGQGLYFNSDFLTMDSGMKRMEGYTANVIEDEAENWLSKRDTTKPFCVVIGHKNTHRTWIPDTMDMGRYDHRTFSLPANFYDDYKGREAAQQQDMSISKTMLMGYDLKMFENEEAENKDGNRRRMNEAQRAKFDQYYQAIKADLDSKNLTGNALTEWKYQRYMKDYLNTAASLDRNVGRILKYLDENNLAENTIVIYTSDQGFYLGEHGWFDKRFMYEESLLTPMIIRYPGVIRPGSVSNDLVMNLDLGPTLLDAAKIPIPKDMQGESILTVINKKSKGRDAVYYHYYEKGEHSVSPHFGIRTHRYKLIRFYNMVNNWELFDLEKDPHEMNNLYGKKGYDKITQQLKGQLKRLIEKYEDDEAEELMKE